MFVCEKCNNKDNKYIGYINGMPYCRRCISFNNGRKVNNNKYLVNDIHANLNYELSKCQQNASNKIFDYIKNNQSVIVNAVCGAGKTELVYKSIEFFINQGKRVGFTIPRKDVCKEIYLRLKDDYPEVSITLVCGGNTSNLNAQLVILTTHQLFRFYNYFDLLILDEADAFPYYGDDMLKTFLHKSIKGPIIYLSATVKDSYKKECKNVVSVNRRFHNVDLPVPEYIQYFSFNKIFILKDIIEKLPNKPILIFAPTIKDAIDLSNKTGIPCIYSSCNEKDEILARFKERKINILITTTILERGITIKSCQVIVYEANHRLFDEATLVQIAGRVGRKISDPTGKVYFLATNMSESMKKSIKEIKSKNETKEYL